MKKYEYEKSVADRNNRFEERGATVMNDDINIAET